LGNTVIADGGLRWDQSSPLERHHPSPSRLPKLHDQNSLRIIQKYEANEAMKSHPENTWQNQELCLKLPSSILVSSPQTHPALLLLL